MRINSAKDCKFISVETQSGFHKIIRKDAGFYDKKSNRIHKN